MEGINFGNLSLERKLLSVISVSRVRYTFQKGINRNRCNSISEESSNSYIIITEKFSYRTDPPASWTIPEQHPITRINK